MAAHDIRIGDVWHRDDYPPEDTITIGAPSDRGQYGQTADAFHIVRGNGRTGRITARKVVASYTLIERGGVRVGGAYVYAGANGAIHVGSSDGDSAIVSRGTETGRIALATLAAMRLVERDGKAI